MEKISLDKIVCESNRKYTKDEGFEQLLNSIKQYGIIEPPIVRRVSPLQYKVIAGRRRIDAARRLDFTEVDCVIREEGDPVDDEEIALTENVNRLDMHPLDEAAAFKRMADEGNPIEEIARYYARSPSAIYKRLRLVPLIEELKVWFRDQVLDISGAALLAELPEEDQKKFYGEHEARITRIIEDKFMTNIKIDNNVLSQFVYKQQKNKIRKCLGDVCQVCKKRTHNTENDLFKEFDHINDVCLDGDCYRAMWKRVIENALAESYNLNLPTDAKIIFRGTVLEMLYKRATHAEFFYADSNTRFEILKDKDCEFTGETKKKTNACWLIHADWDGETTAKRVGYKQKPPREKLEAAEQGKAGTPDKKQIEEYGREVLDAIAIERGTNSAELVKALQEKRFNDYSFNDKIKELVYERVVAMRIEAEKSGAEPPKDYFSMFMRFADEELYGGNTFIEERFTVQQKQWLRDLSGKESIKKISLGLPDETQMLFHFMMLCLGFEREVPEPKELENIQKGKVENLFWKYAGMDEDEYRALYIQAAKDVTAEALEPKPKKAGKKKEAAEAAAPHGEDVPADASGG